MRISATELESYRYWLGSDQSLDSFLDRLTTFERTDKMLAGSAFHYLLEVSEGEIEDAVVYYRMENGREKFDLLPTMAQDEQSISFHIKLDGQIELPVWSECKVERCFEVDGEEVVVVAKSDSMIGRKVADYKLSDGFDEERYTDSLQWRIYLDLFEADSFDYLVFTSKEKKGVWEVSALDRFTLFRYPGMENDVRRAVEDFSRFLRKHLPSRITDGDEKRLMF
jgi:hypothetical protein